MFGLQRGLDRRDDGRADRRSPATVTFGMNTENKVPVWVTSRHLSRSIQTRWAYQSCWLAWPMAGSAPAAASTPWRCIAASRVMIVGKATDDRRAERRGLAPVECGDVLVADLGHFLDMPHDTSGPAQRLAQHLGDIVRAGTAGAVGDPWVSALPCRRRPAHKRCPGRMTIALVGAEALAPIRWWCSVCDDEGVISNWADSPYDLRRRRLGVAGDVDEVIVSDKTAAALRELVLLDPDCERLVFGMRAHPDGAALLTSADDLEELIGFVAAEANHEPNRRRQDRLDAAFNALTEAAQTLYG